MKIVIDIQSNQSSSRVRGIGRFSLHLTKEVIRQAGGHEIYLFLNDYIPETVDVAQKEFKGIISQKNIIVWKGPNSVRQEEPKNKWLANAAELVREDFLVDLKPDIVHLNSLFEGYLDDVVTSIHRHVHSPPTSVLAHDLIPHIFKDLFLKNRKYRDWYYNKLEYLKKANLILANSKSTKKDIIEHLGVPESTIHTIYAASDERFKVLKSNPVAQVGLKKRYQITREFIAFTGTQDVHKNIEALVIAYSKLPGEVRSQHQLVLIGVFNIEKLSLLAKIHGMAINDLIFTGHIPDEDLIGLYNACKLFILPSLYEGFGLPALEAMCCGAPAIGSNTSSIPEVIGMKEALFDPYSATSISEKLNQALTDEGFLNVLRENSTRQSKVFSWADSAKKTIEALEVFHEKKQPVKTLLSMPSVKKPTLAFISPLPPLKSGISHYSSELLPELSQYYDIELVVDQGVVDKSMVPEAFPRVNIKQFKQKANKYDRIVYHFGNSEYHKHMFPLLEEYPGIVVLHDLFLGDIYLWMNQSVLKELYYSHGYPGLLTEKRQGVKKAVDQYPMCKRVLDRAIGTILHSNFSLEMAKETFQLQGEHLREIPMIRRPSENLDKSNARKVLGIDQDALLVISFGMLTQNKQCDRLLLNWEKSEVAKNPKCHLVYVGELEKNFKNQMMSLVVKSPFADRIQIEGYTSWEEYENYLQAADIAVQLRTNTRGETSAAILDCMGHALPTIINANGSATEIPKKCIYLLPDKFDDEALVMALDKFSQTPSLRDEMGEKARTHVMNHNHPQSVSKAYFEAIEHFAKNHPLSKRKQLLKDIVDQDTPGKKIQKSAMTKLSESIAKQSSPARGNIVYLDVATITHHDLKTGIQRVVRSVVNNLLNISNFPYRVEPVYFREGEYYHATQFMVEHLDLNANGLQDTPIDVQAGDIFIALDFWPQFENKAVEYLNMQSYRGLRIFFIIYDLLPVYQPTYFPDYMGPLFKCWINKLVSIADGAICISKATADDFIKWLNQSDNEVARLNPLKIGYFHLGADLQASNPTSGLSENHNAIMATVEKRPTLLMVGTVEVRKGHAQVINAFEQLWAAGRDVGLVIVGKNGWMAEEAKELIENNKENERLIWLENASDEMLQGLYKKASGLLLASNGEGFGLPLIEAAQYGLPIITRDLPVFREVAGDHAFYFTGSSPEELADSLKTWLELYEKGQTPSSKNMPWLTWEESTQQLWNVIENDNWYMTQPFEDDTPWEIKG